MRTACHHCQVACDPDHAREARAASSAGANKNLGFHGTGRRSCTHLGALFFAAAFARGAWSSASESEMLASEELLCMGRGWVAAADASSILTACGCAGAAAGRDGNDAPDSFSLMTGAFGFGGDAGDGCCGCGGGCCCCTSAMGCRGSGEPSSEPDEELDSEPGGTGATASVGPRACSVPVVTLPPGAGLGLRA